jgi:hypothetical protein
MLLDRSPVKTGTYIEAHFVYLNSKLVAKNIGELNSFLVTYIAKPKDIVRIVNVVPYARSLERKGVTAQRTQRKLVKSQDKQGRSGTHVLGANGTYFLSSRAASRLYKNNLGVYFGFVRGNSLPNDSWPSQDKSGRPFRRTFKNGKRPKDRGPYVYPSIKLVFGERGTV